VISEERFQEMLAAVESRRNLEELAICNIAAALVAAGKPVNEVPQLALDLWLTVVHLQVKSRLDAIAKKNGKVQVRKARARVARARS
jgi:hypothetical protein